jgi:DNA-binding SARP family transcriptional activator
MTRLYLLGASDLHDDDGGDRSGLLAQPRLVALLVYLAIAGPRPGAYHRRDRLVGLFWPESGQEQARANLRKAVHLVRKALGEGIVEARGDEELRLSPAVWCDVVEFEDTAARGRLARADELYRGELLPGFFLPGAPEFARWLDARRRELAELAADVAWKLATRLEGERNVTDAARWAIRAARLSLNDERKFLRAIQLLDRAGLGGRAIDLYHELTRRLAELGIEPSPEIRALIEELRRRRSSG